MAALLITAAFLLGLGFRECGLPPLVGYLAAGFLINLAGFHDIPGLDELAHAGVLLLLFAVGLKLRLQTILKPEVWGTALLHLAVICTVVGSLFSMAGWSAPLALLLAAALGFSSTVVAAKVLEQKRELRAFHGRVAIGILVFQDLVAVALLGVAGGVTPSPWAVLLLGLPLLSRPLNWLLEFSGHDELLVLFGLVLALVLGGAGFEGLGLSSELGALVLGSLVATHRRASELAHALWSLKEVFLVGFFLQIGMHGLPTLEAAGIALALLLLLPLKAGLFFFILLAFRLRARSAFLASLSLASYSEFALIVIDLAADNGWFAADAVVLLSLTVALSFAVAAPVNRFAHGLYGRWEPWLTRFEHDEHHPDEQPLALGNATILIMGMGRVGTGAYDFLGKRYRVVGLDSDPDRVVRLVHEGRRVLYADSEDPFFWQKLKIDRLYCILLAMPDPEAKQIAIRELRRRDYQGLICATITFDDEAREMQAAGVNVIFNHYREAGVGFAERAWEAMQERSQEAAGLRPL
jgi:predicted Kef-type K+ transport protein